VAGLSSVGYNNRCGIVTFDSVPFFWKMNTHTRKAMQKCKNKNSEGRMNKVIFKLYNINKNAYLGRNRET
jgi:hypothetical protein